LGDSDDEKDQREQVVPAGFNVSFHGCPFIDLGPFHNLGSSMPEADCRLCRLLVPKPDWRSRRCLRDVQPEWQRDPLCSDMVSVVPRAATVFIEATSTSLGVTLNQGVILSPRRIGGACGTENNRRIRPFTRRRQAQIESFVLVRKRSFDTRSGDTVPTVDSSHPPPVQNSSPKSDLPKRVTIGFWTDSIRWDFTKGGRP
jgi:hypothetical protein